MPERMSVTSTRSEDIPQSFSILFKRTIRPNSLDTLIKNNLDDCNKSSAVSSSTCSENELETLDSVNVSTITNLEEGLSNSEECERENVAKIDKNCVDYEMNSNSCLKETSEDQKLNVKLEDKEEEKSDMSESSSPQNRRKTRRPEKKDVVFLRSKRIQSRILTKQNLDPIQQNLAKKLSSNHLLVKQDDISGYSKTVSNTHSVKGIENQKAVKTVCHKSKSTVIPGKQSITVNTDIGDSKSLKLKIQSNCDINMTEAVNSTRHTCDNTTTKSSVHKAVLKPSLLEGDMNSDKINLNESSEKNSDINTTPKIKKVPDRLVVSLKPLPALSENNAPVSQVDSNLENNCNTDKLARNKRKRPRNLLEIKSRPRRSKSVRKIEGRDSLKEKVISDYFLNQKESSACSKETINNQISDSVDFQGISNRRRKINDNEPYINAKKRKIDHDNLELSSKPSGSSSNIDKNVCVSNDGSLFSCLAENSLNPFTEVSINKEYIKEQVSSTPSHLKVENCSPVSGTECTENLSVMKGGKKDDKSCSGCSVLLKSIRDPNSQSSGSILQQYGSIGVSCPANEGNVISNVSESECGQHLNASNTSFPSTVSNHIDSELPEKVCSQSVQILTLPTDESLYPSDSLDVIESSQDSSFCSMPLHVNKFSAIKSNTANSLSVNKQECELNSCVSLSSPKSLKSKSEIENSLPVTHTVQTDAVANFERKDASSESVSGPETLVYGEEKPNAVSVLTEEPQINQSINVADQSTSKRKRKKEPIERLMKNLEIDFKSSFVPSGSRQPNTLEKKRNSLSITNNDTKSSAKRRHSTSSDNRRNKRRGERNVEQLKQETQSLPENLKDRNFSSDSTISSMERLEADRDCQVTNKEEADNNSQSNLTYIDKATCTDSEDLRIRIIFAVGEDKVCHKMDKSDGDKPRILPIMENISIPCNVTDSKFDNPLISDNIQDVKERNECSEEIRITDGRHASNDITKTLDKNINNSKNPAVDVNKSVDKVQVLVHRKMDNVGLNTLHNECTEPLRALDLISINSFNTNVGKSSNNFSELKENSFPSSDNGTTVSHGSDQFTSRPKLTLHMRKKRHNIMSPSAGDTKSKFKNQSSPAKMKNAESKILSSGMTGRAAHLLGLAVSEVAFEERNQPSTSQTKDKKEFRHFKEFQMNKREDFSADKIYITSSDGNVSTSLWVKHEYKSKACPAATILKSSKVPVIQQHHEVPCMDVSPGKVRKRVSFFDPVVSHKLLFRTDAPSIVHTFDHPILEESNDLYGTSNESVQECTHDELQVNITPVSSSQNDAILDSQSAIWPTLTECENPVDVIISDITTPFWTESTIAAFKERGIITVGDLCKLNEKSFMKLQISSPTLEAVKLAIKRYEEKLLNSMDTSEPSIDENPHHESVTIEEITDETSDCINETEDECCVELYEETIQLDKASECDTSDLIKESDNFEDSLSLREHIKLIARKYSAKQIHSVLESEGIFKPNCVCDQETVNAIKTLYRRLDL